MSDQSANKQANLHVDIVIQPSASHYRAPFMRSLLRSEKVNFTLLGKRSGSVTDPVSADYDVMSNVVTFSDIRIWRSFRWQSGIVSRAASTKSAMVVLEGNPYILSTWVAMLVLKLRGKSVVLWGHGWKRPDVGAKLLLRKIFYRIATGHLVYGDWAREYAGTVGLDDRRFYTVYNSVYSELLVGLGVEGSALRQPGSISLIYCGRLTGRHSVDLAIQAASLVEKCGISVNLTVVGDGPEHDELVRQSNEQNAPVQFVGPIYDANELADLYAKADFAVSPGASGLNVVQALNYGVPVIAAEGNPESGPELEAVSPGITGYTFEDGSAQSLRDAIIFCSRLPDETYQSNTCAALKCVREKYTAERHAHAVVSALVHIHEKTF
ncbi:glycosyltransferase family 4 protein [Dietzia cinnamea]|uniref:glycosyltransferase family 4 protein n=1 Tax=Dietzia cinnamea TaxID=321318 RepID=UPI0021A5CECD|nr:glycosyltransferase [Dietzia cinnamea]MCT2140670.1 glycosyltransferase [Dietzia cinnamea]